MNNKDNKDEFLGYINSLWKQGQISESVLIKIRNEYCKEKLKWQEVSVEKTKIDDQTASIEKVLAKDSEEEKLIKEEFSEINDLDVHFESETIEAEKINSFEKTLGEINKPLKDSYIINKNQNREQQNKLTKERNITLILSLGIILILLAGIILATSTWFIMSNGTKTIALLMVSILFFAMSSFTERKLKIVKTSFAFWVLGNLFLPIIFLSIGFFKLLGNYLSIGGSGRYIYGIISAFICLIFFVYSIKKYKNTAFIWISLIDLQLLYWFILKQLYFNYNTRVLMMLIYTLILSCVYLIGKRYEGIYAFVLKTIKYYSFINIISCIFQVLGICIYATVMIMAGKPCGVIQGLIITFGVFILAVIVWLWMYELKFQGGVFVTSLLILVIHMLAITFKIKMDVFAYYILMSIGMSVVYGVIYYFNDFKYLKKGSDILILISMTCLDLISIIPLKALYVAILLYLLGTLIVITSKKSKNQFYVFLLKSIIPINIFIANLFALSGLKLIDNIFANSRFHLGFIYIILNIGIIYAIGFIYGLKNNSSYKIYLYEGHAFLGIIYLLTLFFQIDRIIAGIAVIIVTAFCFIFAKNELKIKVYLYLFITMFTMVLLDLELFYRFNKLNIFILKPQNIFLCISLVLTIIWWCTKEPWKKRLNSYIIGIYSFGFINSMFLNDFQNLNFLFIFFLIAALGIMALFLYKQRKIILMFIPLGFFWIMSFRIIYYFELINQITANWFIAFIIGAVGYELYNIDESSGHRELLYCSTFSGISLVYAIIISLYGAVPFIFNVFSFIVFGGSLYYLSQIVEGNKLKRNLFIASIFINYIGYGRFISELDFLENFQLDFLLIPFIIVLHLIIKYYLQKKNIFWNLILRSWYVLTGIILMFSHKNNSSFEAITYCILCIISVIVGFILQRRLYFIGGAVFLLIGVFLYTLNFWLNIPWWIYLLTGGALLIFFASKNELNKRNKRESIIGKFIKKVKMW
ncbi:hypothetical protein [Clostridium sp. C2-6-12]|uniref:hypothetical protein n=1 Tax=Clostridium sp. C2-6-12 TaxID=2698832 RepID=UPI001368C62C|nr:hypothetical protein [Clostridium sp. C2-6-12]